jgi:hypothetical protein
MKPSFLDCPVSAFVRAGSQVWLKLQRVGLGPLRGPTASRKAKAKAYITVFSFSLFAALRVYPFSRHGKPEQ